MNQQATQSQTSNDTSMSGMGNKCQVAFCDMLDRFLSSGIGIDYRINTQMLQKASDGTWQTSSQGQDSNASGTSDSAAGNTPASNQAPQKGMTKQGSIKIGTPDLVVGMLMVCLVSGLCMGMHCVKKMFR